MEIKYAVYAIDVAERGDFSRYGLSADDIMDMANKAKETTMYEPEYYTDASSARAAFESSKVDVDTEQYGPGVAGYNGPHIEAGGLFLDCEEWEGDDFVQADTLDFFAKPLPAADEVL